MKKFNLAVAAILLSSAVMFSSCVGSFSLFNKYAHWQTHMTDNKYVNGIVGVILLPICGSITCLADALVLNTIEFWSGTNPLEANKTTKVQGEDGHYYAVKTLKNGYKITDENGDVTYLMYNKKEDSWSMVQNGETREIFRFNDDGSIKARLLSGKTVDVSNDEAGLMKIQNEVMTDQLYFAYN